VALAACRWALAHGDDPRLRICLCGYEGDHKMPKSWTAVRWKAHGGMSGTYKGRGLGRAQKNRFREILWFSPHCLKV